MPLTLLFAALTLAPAIAALLVAALGLAKRALPGAVLVLAALGMLVPAIGLLALAPYLASGDPLRATLYGGVTGPTAWFSPIYRADALSLYAGLGLAFLVAPVLLWLAWKGPTVEPLPAEDDGGAVTAPGLARPIWGSVALALGVESAAMTVLFGDNILWLGLSWVVLAALAWGVGEIGAGGDTVDRAGIFLLLAGPVLWTVVMMTGAGPAKAPTLYDLMGRGSFSVIQVIMLALTLALAGGVYPFTVWVRRRAVLATPAGVGAVVLALLPVALYVGARTYSAAQDAASAWPAIGKATPPISAGIAFVVLGAITVAVAGLTALERRDVRSLLALLAAAQVGWGFLALGTGEPGGALGLTVLLATAVFGLGAMTSAAFAGGTLGDDDERDGAGPRPFGAFASTANLAAWCVGAVTLIGAPLFGGFVSRQMISASALQLGNLTIPLVGLAWAGDGLLALALLRLTAPAFAAVSSRSKAQLEAETLSGELASGDPLDVPVFAPTTGDAAGVFGSETDEDTFEFESDGEEFDEDGADEFDVSPATSTMNDLRELPGLVFAALALVAGIAPQVLLNFGGTLAAGDLAQAHVVDGAVHTLTLGYTTGPGQWLASIAWLALAVLLVAVALLRPGGDRAAKPVLLDGQAEADIADPDGVMELAGMSAPADAWRDLAPAFASPFTVPAAEWLLPVADGVDVEALAGPDEEDVAEDEDGAELFVDGERVVEADTAYERDAGVQAYTSSVTPPAADAGEATPGDTAERDQATGAATEAAGEPEPFVVAEPEPPVDESSATDAAAPAVEDAPAPAKTPATVAARNNNGRGGNQGNSRPKYGKSGRSGKKGGR